MCGVMKQCAGLLTNKLAAVFRGNQVVARCDLDITESPLPDRIAR
jgi:hypothetical protein